MTDRRGRPRSFPKKATVFAQRLWAAWAYRNINASLLSDLTDRDVTAPQIHNLATDPRTAALTKENSDRLNALADALLVEPTWLRGLPSEGNEPQPRISAFLEQERSKAVNRRDVMPVTGLPPPPPPPPSAQAWWSQLAAAWENVIAQTHNGKLQRRLIQLTDAPDACGKPWPTFRRQALCWPAGRMDGYEALPLRPISQVFTTGQAIALAQVLMPGVAIRSLEELAQEQRFDAALSGDEPSPFPEPIASILRGGSRPHDPEGSDLAARVVTLTVRKGDKGTYGALIDLLDQHLKRPKAKVGILRQQMVWTFLADFPDDKPMLLFKLISVYQHWRSVWGRHQPVFDPEPPATEEERRLRNSRRFREFYRTYQGKFVPMKTVLEQLAWVTGGQTPDAARPIMQALVRRHWLIPRGKAHVLVPDREDQERWSRGEGGGRQTTKIPDYSGISKV